MSNFNQFERHLAKLLMRFPRTKNVLKRIYQKLQYISHRPMKHYWYKPNTTLICFNGQYQQETFFGYYDKSPVTVDGRYTLYHQTSHPTTKPPDPAQSIDVVVYDNEQQQVIKSIATNAYNWQQGARAMWLDNRTFIMNAYDANQDQFFSKMVDVVSDQVDRVDWPVYDCYQKQFALTLNFDRLAQLRPDYGYFNKKQKTDIHELRNDGIFFLNLLNNKCRLLISLEALANQVDLKQKYQHKVNHIMIAPCGKRFMFLHRYLLDSGMRQDRLMIANVDGSQLKVLADDEMVSHCYWLDEKTILGYLRDHQQGDRYYQIDIESGHKQSVGQGVIDQFGDGHPTIWKGQKIVFDTYPDKSRMKTLHYFDFIKKEHQVLGGFFESFKYHGQTRCDLHPRLSPNGQAIYFDSVHTGRRQLYQLKME